NIGYSYVVEEAYTYGPHPGVLVAVRSRLIRAEQPRIDTAASMIIRFDRKHGFRTINSVIKQGERTRDSSETGTSDQRFRPVVVKPDAVPDASGEATPSGQSRVQTVPEYLLSVTRAIGRNEQEPMIRQLP